MEIHRRNYRERERRKRIWIQGIGPGEANGQAVVLIWAALPPGDI